MHLLTLLFAASTTFVGCERQTTTTEDGPTESTEQASTNEPGEEAASDESATPDFGSEDPLQLNGHPWAGAINAPVTIVEFSDFECPYCQRGANSVHEVLEAYPDQVRVVFKQLPLPFHSHANLAAQASLAAHAQGNEHFWEFHDLLFENRSALERADLERYAEQIGLDMDVFRTALDEGTYADAVTADSDHAGELGIRGTPNFLINGTGLRGAQPIDAFRTVIDAEITATQALIDAGSSVGDAFAARVEENLQAAPAPTPDQAERPARPTPDPAAVLYVPVGDSAAQGPADALVTIVEFSEFQCPYCSRVQPTMEQIHEEFGDNVRIVFKHLPLGFHDRAEPAARATIAAQNQGKFWEMHDLMFANQRELTDENLDAWAEQLGLNLDQFHTDMASEATTARIAEDGTLATRLAARGTPHFFVNGIRLRGAQPFERFQTVINEQLEIAQALIDAGTPRAGIYEALQAEAVRGPAPMIQPAGNAGANNRPAAPAEPPAAVEIPILPTEPSRGPADAAVTVVEYSDFQCPYCSRYANSLDEALEGYEDRVRLVFKQFPLGFHDHAQLAAEASLAAHAQGKFWEMHDLLFANQRALTRENLNSYGEQIGLNMEEYGAALDNNTYREEVQRQMAEGQGFGVRGTPSWFINGRMYSGAQAPAQIRALFDAELE